MNRSLKIPNKQNELLDVLIEGNDTSSVTVVMAHGFGADKHETQGMFDDIAASLIDKYRIIRFDFAGYGKSEGRSEDVDLGKLANDLKTILTWTRETFTPKIYLIAHSLGTAVTSLLKTSSIEKSVFTGLVSATSQSVVESFEKRIQGKPGGVINKQSISIYPRTVGQIQKLGSNFWKSLESFDPLRAISSYGKKTDLLLVHPLQEDFYIDGHFSEYQSIPYIKYIEINGDHSFTRPDDREKLLEVIKNHFK